jgi:hypothetical protein
MLHEHYADPEQTRRLLRDLNHPRAAALLARDVAPVSHSLRLGDLGEILLAAFIQEALGVPVPLRRLRTRENRKVPLPGDDVVGILFDRDILVFVKGEAKARKHMRQRALDDAWQSLKNNHGHPSRIAVAKIERELSKTDPAAARAVLSYLFKGRKAAHYHVTFALYERINDDLLDAFLSKVGRTHPHYAVGIELSAIESATRRIFTTALVTK